VLKVKSEWPEEESFMAILEKAQRMLEKYPLCNHCLGRQFALLGHGLDDQKRGESLKTLLTMKGHQLALADEKPGLPLLRTVAVNGASEMAGEVLKKLGKRAGKKRVCCLCEGRFGMLDELVEMSVKKLKAYEFSTFLVGIRLPSEIAEREDEFKAEFDVKHGESMRNEFSRDIGKRISELTHTPVDYRKPDIVVIITPFTQRVTLQVNPFYIAGRYRKLARGIPQSKWLCVECGGKGCERCNGIGKMYPESVEEIIAEPTLEETGGDDTSFHGSGREDVDARMLGRGRPFIIEVKKPKMRFVDLRALSTGINDRAQGKVKVLGLRVADKDDVRRLKKGEGSEKVYRVLVEFGRDVSDEELETLVKTLTNITIRQQTPRRVLHRRADLIREKYIYEAEAKRVTPNRVEMKIHSQGGLYIKELVTGDEGRTDPSVAQIVSAAATPLELDVLEVI
jgi:tRNA pseudouridine synthase 10